MMTKRRLVDGNMRGRRRRALLWIVQPERAAIEGAIEHALGHVLADGYSIRLDWHDGQRVAIVRGDLSQRFTDLAVDLRTSPGILTDFLNVLDFTLIGPAVIVDDRGWLHLVITTESILPRLPRRGHWALMPWQQPGITDEDRP
jgi:hypothetical protein